MIKKYDPIILSIETSSNLLSISIKKNNNIIYIELIKNRKIEFLLEFLNNILIKNRINIEKINLIATSYNLFHYTNLNIISSIIQCISLCLKIPTITVEYQNILAKKLINSNKYILISTRIDKKNIYQEMYTKKYLIFEKIIQEKKNQILLKNNIRNINIKEKFVKSLKIRSIEIDNFIRKKLLFNKFILPNKIIPKYPNKNFYIYYKVNKIMKQKNL